VEQADYLEGVLWSDADHRLDMDPARDVGREIDAYGTGTAAFWRGVLETAGHITIMGRGNGYKYPRVELAGSYSFLCKFLDFIQEEMESQGQTWQWDVDGKLRSMASRNHFRVTGHQAPWYAYFFQYVEVCIDQSYSSDSARQQASYGHPSFRFDSGARKPAQIRYA
jgi:hypothetical protein